MTKVVFFALALVGCGGPSFTVGFDRGTGGAPEADAMASSGGKAALNTGGSLSSGGASSGGAGGSSGGVAGSGVVDAGGRGSGGATVEADAGSGGHMPGCNITHDNGAGQSWDDCEPLGTYNEAQAMKACKASHPATCVASTRCGPKVLEVQGFDADGILVAEWGYGDFATGLVSLDYNLCSPSDPGRRQWR